MSWRRQIAIVVIMSILLAGLTLTQIAYEAKQPSNISWLPSTSTIRSYTSPKEANTPPISLEAVTFTHTPLENDAYNYIIALGNVATPSHTFPSDHIYFVLEDGSYDVVAPASGTITSITNWTQSDWSYQDYALTIKHTNTFESYFYHLSGIADWILEKTGNIPFRAAVNIPVSGGQVIGRAQIQPGGSVCLDWGVANYEVTLNFIHPETYGEYYNVHAVCPLDYLEEGLKESVYQKVNRIGEPRGGKIDYDLLGRLSGNWFLEGSTPGKWNWSTHLAFVYSVYNASQMIVAVGSNVLAPLPMGEYNATGPDFREVSADNGIVTYHLVGINSVEGQVYTLIAQVVGDERIKVETFEGYQEGKNFTEKALFYTRTGPGVSDELNVAIIDMLVLIILNQSPQYSQRIPIILEVAGGAAAILVVILGFVLWKKRH